MNPLPTKEAADRAILHLRRAVVAPLPQSHECSVNRLHLQTALDYLMAGWRPIESAPRDCTFILLAGPSGYTSTPLRVTVGHYSREYNAPWRTHSNDSFTDGGPEPTHWMPLQAAPSP